MFIDTPENAFIQLSHSVIVQIYLKHEGQSRALIHDVVEKAEGAFLWVVLVVQSVVRGLGEGDSISMLRHRVQTFPADLEKFFWNILSRVNEVYKAQTSQALKLAYMLAEDYDHHHEKKRIYHRAFSSFFDYWLIGQSPEGLADPGFAFALNPREASHDEIVAMVSQTRNMLCSACKDLLFIPNDNLQNHTEEIDAGKNPLCNKVELLHRTVYEFLRKGFLELLDSSPSQIKVLCAFS